MRNIEAVQMTSDLADIVLGAPITQRHLESLQKWARIGESEQGGMEFKVVARIAAELSELRETVANGGQLAVTGEVEDDVAYSDDLAESYADALAEDRTEDPAPPTEPEAGSGDPAEEWLPVGSGR